MERGRLEPTKVKKRYTGFGPNGTDPDSPVYGWHGASIFYEDPNRDYSISVFDDSLSDD